MTLAGLALNEGTEKAMFLIDRGGLIKAKWLIYARLIGRAVVNLIAIDPDSPYSIIIVVHSYNTCKFTINRAGEIYIACESTFISNGSETAALLKGVTVATNNELDNAVTSAFVIRRVLNTNRVIY